ncbi:uncharacterized protein LOC123298635 [Chrysoperla carnea]|uniref:uncharacterized protein LOC123298635 n=1 Tax=Chrysoperla carnea TaxID=189513 RepID=UPI001D098E70|nr:uncharacterized protein LOC123298635 [Chrysoperla carnea]
MYSMSNKWAIFVVIVTILLVQLQESDSSALNNEVKRLSRNERSLLNLTVGLNDEVPNIPSNEVAGRALNSLITTLLNLEDEVQNAIDSAGSDRVAFGSAVEDPLALSDEVQNEAGANDLARN